MLSRRFHYALVAVASATVVSFAAAEIIGSGHDFSQYGWSRNQICLPCHTPHNANVEAGALWNRENPADTTFTLYEGTVGTAENVLDRKSRLCLSCHDGTIALDSYGGATGTHYISGDALIGTDLSDDHPIGADAVYPLTGSWGLHPAAEGRRGMNINGLYLVELDNEHVVSCNTCHNPHNSRNQPFMLRMDNTGSALCLNCHIK